MRVLLSQLIQRIDSTAYFFRYIESVTQLAIFLCSYLRDLERVRRLHSSIVKFNLDQLPVYIAVPRADLAEFRSVISDPSINWLTQEDVFASTPSARTGNYQNIRGGDMQQVVKSESWRLGIAENMLVMDSDCKFLSPFQTSDFITDDGTPYSVVTEGGVGGDVHQLSLIMAKPQIWLDWIETSDRTRQYFGNSSLQRYGYAGAPYIWSSRVWSDLSKIILEPSGKTFLDLVYELGSELVIYGEALLALKSIPFKPHKPYFRMYCYERDLWSDRSQGIDESVLAKSYLGVTNQSNWEYWTDHRSYRKSLPSRVARTLRRNIALVRWRFQSRD